jgi:asparagine synthase (glutamine-hydrolysing)
MCGISILLDPAGSPDFNKRLLAMHAQIRHRGPDGEGFLVVDRTGAVIRSGTADGLAGVALPRVGFAFRRLKICDLSELADQPMGSADRKTWVAFNGEIYNFRELRRELESLGQVFRTHGDTEVVLAAYEQWGEGSFDRLDGMWGIVILDLRRNRLVVSRDRFGIKPVYWKIDRNGAILLASEIKQILAACDAEPRRTNRPLIAAYLRGFRYPTLEETFFEGIRSIPPATWCEIDLAAPTEPRFQAYWNLGDYTATDNTLSYDEVLAKVEARLAAAVHSHRQADVKVGALLSGGLDSSTLVGMAHRNGSPKLPTYSIGYRDAAPAFCEMPFVDAMTRRDGIENHETTFDAAWIADNADCILWTLEEPPLAMPAFAQYRMFEFCAEHGATVILDGQGADEITAGYPYHQRAFIKERLLRRQLLAAWSELRAIARRERRSAFAVFHDFFLRPYTQRRPPLPWIAEAGPRTSDPDFALARGDYGHDPSLVNRQLYFDVHWGNVKIVLGYGDRNAMAHSIEARVPYFDRAFVELMFSLPDTFKIGNGDRKRALRDVARRYVPPEITERADRMGYGTPDEAMIRGPLSEVVADALNDPAFRAAGWIVPEQTDRFWLDFREGRHNDFRAIWRLFALSRWARRFSLTA